MDNAAVDRLIKRVALNDMDALEQLYNELSRAVYAFVMTVVKDPAAAEDVTQDTFVRLYYGAKKFKAGGLGKAWIMRIARNLALNAVTRGTPVVSDDETETERPGGDNTESSAITNVMLANAMAYLSDEERQVITLHAMSGMKLSEIAEVLGQPLGTVKWRHAQALRRLREMMGEDDG